MKTKTTWLAVLAAVVALAAVQTVSAGGAHSRYKVTDLGTLPGLANSYVWAQILNNRGHVAVYASNDADPNALGEVASYLWKSPGDITVLPGLPGAATSIAFGLNDRDQVAGASGPNVDGYYHAVLWDRGIVHDLGTLPGLTDSEAWLVNNAGIVIGDCWNANVEIDVAVYWYRGQIFPLPPLNDGDFSIPYGINDWGQIVGQSGPDWEHVHTVLWRLFPKPSVMDLGTLGGDNSSPSAINNRGEIVGLAQTASGDWHPTLWDKNGITDLQNFGDDLLGSAYAVNNCGQIVGFSGLDFNDVTTQRALLWENGKIVNLQTQIPGNSGWVLQQAAGINDRGQIAGLGLHNGAFLLTPNNAPHR
jgi:probable HAF family extracellular repeat protein